MLCPKVHNWFNLRFECPNEELFTESICISYWVTLVGGTGVQVCASCKIWLVKNGLTERSHCEEKKGKSGE